MHDFHYLEHRNISLEMGLHLFHGQNSRVVAQKKLEMNNSTLHEILVEIICMIHIKDMKQARSDFAVT